MRRVDVVDHQVEQRRPLATDKINRARPCKMHRERLLNSGR
jgi:hypothetical protein